MHDSKKDTSDSEEVFVLKKNVNDRIVSVTKAIVSLVPLVGGILGEIVSEIIPNQRIDRIESYLRILTLEMKKKSFSDNEFKSEFFAFLVEEGMFQAARSLTENRRKFIVSCVLNGISQDHKDKLRERKILDCLAELHDDEILILDAYGDSKNANEKFANVVPSPPVIGAPREVHEQNLFFESSQKKLERLGLLYFRINKDFDSNMPEFDRFSGKMRGYYHITIFGRILLQRIGLIEALDEYEVSLENYL